MMPSGGYNWQPFKFPIYVKPWLGIGYTSKISGSNALVNLEYDISPIVPSATVHVGYTLKQIHQLFADSSISKYLEFAIIFLNFNCFVAASTPFVRKAFLTNRWFAASFLNSFLQ